MRARGDGDHGTKMNRRAAHGEAAGAFAPLTTAERSYAQK